MALPFTNFSALFGGLRISSACAGMIGSLTPTISQVRGRKRNLKKPLSREERLARRRKREEKEAARKQYTFMERIKIRKMKSLLSPSQQGPGRYDAEAEAELPEIPVCNVFIRSEFRTQFYPIAEVLEFHRLQQRPEIYNNPNASVKLRLELNMTTEKATKLIPASDEIVPVPHVFKIKEKRAILAFAADLETQAIATEAGAETAVGTDAVKKIVKGQFRIDDYDFCVAHTNVGSHMAPLRGILRSRFPTKINGAMGDNLVDIIERFRNGVKVSIRGDPVYPMWGLCEPVIGKLDMSNEQLEENIGVIIGSICKHRSPALGSFINRCTLGLEMGKIFVPIDVSNYTPKATEEDLEALEKKSHKKKKKAKDVETVAEAEKKDDYLLALM